MNRKNETTGATIVENLPRRQNLTEAKYIISNVKRDSSKDDLTEATVAEAVVVRAGMDHHHGRIMESKGIERIVMGKRGSVTIAEAKPIC